MANLILFDSEARKHLLPLSATRPMADMRIGAFTIREKWEHALQGTVSYMTKDYLSERFPIRIGFKNHLINAGLLPTPSLCEKIMSLQLNEALIKDDELIAACLSEAQIEQLVSNADVEELEALEMPNDIELKQVRQLWDLLKWNDSELTKDIEILCHNKKSVTISNTNTIIGSGKVFLSPGASMEACTVNTTKGPVYIAEGVEVMEGCLLRGPLYVGPNSIVKMGAKIYGPTAIGPGCRVGGEITRSIFFGNSNKAHEGYLGDSVLGEWCNIGADSNNSNLKNNYSEVKLWDYSVERFVPTGMQFCGMFMGDHAKCGINTMFNTGTVVGVFANVFGAGYQRNFIPDFSWGGPDSAHRTYKLAEAVATASTVVKRRNLQFGREDEKILEAVFEKTAAFRTWDKK